MAKWEKAKSRGHLESPTSPTTTTVHTRDCNSIYSTTNKLAAVMPWIQTYNAGNKYKIETLDYGIIAGLKKKCWKKKNKSDDGS